MCVKFDVYNLTISQDMEVWRKSTVYKTEQGMGLKKRAQKPKNQQETTRNSFLLIFPLSYSFAD